MRYYFVICNRGGNFSEEFVIKHNLKMVFIHKCIQFKEINNWNSFIYEKWLGIHHPIKQGLRHRPREL